MVYQLKDVSVYYGGQAALKQVSCTIHQGKWISVIGQTGAGKSTFVKVLKGLIADIEGDYLMNDLPVIRDSKGRLKVIRDIGYVFQYPEHQLFETTVHKELAFGPKQHGYTSKKIMERIHIILPLVGLSEELLPLPPFQLSGGQKRRLAIAAVLMMDPKVLIVDEPTVGLDPVSRIAMLELLQNWQQQEGHTLIFVSHSMEDVAEYSDEVFAFHKGEFIGQYDSNTLFLEQSHIIEEIGLSLPVALQLLRLVEERSGRKISVPSCREEDIISVISSIWNARGV